MEDVKNIKMTELLEKNQKIKDELKKNRDLIKLKIKSSKIEKIEKKWDIYKEKSRKKFAFKKKDTDYMNKNTIITIKKYLEKVFFKNYKILKLIIIDNIFFIKINKNLKFSEETILIPNEYGEDLELNEELKLWQINPNNIIKNI